MKPSFSRSAVNGTLLSSREAEESVTAFMKYAGQQIGIPIPVGVQQRGVLIKNFKREMEEQGWTLVDMVGTVRWIKREGYHPATLWQLLRYVDWARKDSVDAEVDLQGKVAEALHQETDPVWRRRLSLAQGRALALVYQNWKKERG